LSRRAETRECGVRHADSHGDTGRACGDTASAARVLASLVAAAAVARTSGLYRVCATGEKREGPAFQRAPRGSSCRPGGRL